MNDLLTVTKTDTKFAKAIDTIVANCGAQSLTSLLAIDSRLSRKEIETISRMAPPRQRYELEQVALGRRPFRKPKHGLPPLDTVKFQEVQNRLERFAGKLAKAIRILPQDSRPSPEQRARLLARLTAVKTNVRLHRQMMRRPPGGTIGSQMQSLVQPPKGMPVAMGSFSNLFVTLAQGNGFLEKNLRDVPRLPCVARPTEREKAVIETKTAAIIRDVNFLFVTIGQMEDRPGR